MSLPIKLIVGLGNPESDYGQTRHNAGAWLLDKLARNHSVDFKSEARFNGLTGRLQLDGCDSWLLKPTTFMNRSGQAVVAMSQYYKIPVENILVVHDELDLPPGSVRLKQGGGHGGHNGLRDIISALGGNKEFLRLRIGIGHPGDSKQVSDYVLQKPSSADQSLIENSIDDALAIMPLVMEGELEKAMHRLHSE